MRVASEPGDTVTLAAQEPQPVPEDLGGACAKTLTWPRPPRGLWDGATGTLLTFADEAFEVEVLVLHAQRLAFAGFPAVLAADASSSSLLGLLLLQRPADGLLLEH